MDKQNIGLKFEVPASQEKTLVQIQVSIETPTPVSANNQTKFALLIFLPLALIFFGIGHALFFLNLSFFSFKLIFFIVTGVSICTYGFCAFEIHTQGPVTNKDKLKENKWHLYNQYWFNGLGAFVGWMALYVLLFYRIGIETDHSHCYWVCFFENIKWQDFILMLVAFFGITGHFPYAALIGKLKQ